MTVTERLKAEAAVETCDLNHKFLFLPDHPRNHLNHKYCVYCTAQWFPALRERWKQMEEGNTRCELGHAFVAMADHPKDKESGALICPHCVQIAYEQIEREMEAATASIQAQLAQLKANDAALTERASGLDKLIAAQGSEIARTQRRIDEQSEGGAVELH